MCKSAPGGPWWNSTVRQKLKKTSCARVITEKFVSKSVVDLTVA